MAVQSFAILSVLLSAVLAQSTSNPFIPSGISTNCSDYLNTLNNNAALIACTSPFTTALQAFTPGGNTTSLSSSAINSSLSALCAANAFSQCSQSTVTTQLSSFYAACPAELTSAPNQEVKTMYDVLYSLLPLKLAICSRDDNGNYCAAELSNSSSTGTAVLVNSGTSQSVLSQYLSTPVTNGAATRRDLSNTTALIPNTTTYQDTNLLFLFRQPSMSNSELCTTCTRNIMTSYITFESSCPYGPGLGSSLLLLGQVDLYNNITSKCGSSFLNGAVQAAGGISSGLMNGAAPRAGGQEFSAAASAILGVAAFVAATL